MHHRYAEENHIPPQAFWLWNSIEQNDTEGISWDEIEADSVEEIDWYSDFDKWDHLNEKIPLPEQVKNRDIPEHLEPKAVDKWGDDFALPQAKKHRDRIKYQSSRHLMPLYWQDDTDAGERIENDDTELNTIENLIGIPLVITHKMDGGNCMLVNDMSNPVRARRGSGPTDTMRPLYRDGGLYWTQMVNQKLPDRLQVFGEWLWSKHSIHYGCNCEPPCEDVGPALSNLTNHDDDTAYFQVFGVFDKRMDIWLSWNETERIADELGFPTAPVIYCEDHNDQATFETPYEAKRTLLEYAHEVVDDGGEGIVVRSKFPFHYGQFGIRLGKYVRENHVDDDDDHCRHTETVRNQI